MGSDSDIGLVFWNYSIDVSGVILVLHCHGMRSASGPQSSDWVGFVVVVDSQRDLYYRTRQI